ncbi:hypothetical protein H9P43_003517 [Blastocladiella emersonii ATCC 22665]|nr:hypothetical protein H9P43_003517 [Blastocladiella emersonii ATCC 22665]
MSSTPQTPTSPRATNHTRAASVASTASAAAAALAATEARTLSAALERASGALAALVRDVTAQLAEASATAHATAVHVHAGAVDTVQRVEAPSAAAAGLVARADELGNALNDRLVAIYEDVRAVHLALDFLEPRVDLVLANAATAQAPPQSK